MRLVQRWAPVGRLHIAHLLWGGLLMLAGLVVLLAVLGKTARRWAAVLGGSGFGRKVATRRCRAA